MRVCIYDPILYLSPTFFQKRLNRFQKSRYSMKLEKDRRLLVLRDDQWIRFLN